MEAKTIQKYKDKSVSKLLATATTHFNKFIRLRDSEDGYGRCISSGQALVVPSFNAHAGHFYSGGKYPELKFDEDNVHLQGKSDNYFNGGNENEYRRSLLKKIGVERVERLDLISAQSKRNSYKWDRIHLIEIIEVYKAKNKLK
tara:strand:+ start:4625 stop:5056 length:432 start_codon:yes stop_codon:yes gene_type:complete